MFPQALALEIGSRGITFNNVQPGPVDTELNPATGDWAVPQKTAATKPPCSPLWREPGCSPRRESFDCHI
jgi:NAD(P)-dependent dehydrogenase (short-subunit alcohol dehydrogenase family)